LFSNNLDCVFYTPLAKVFKAQTLANLVYAKNNIKHPQMNKLQATQQTHSLNVHFNVHLDAFNIF